MEVCSSSGSTCMGLVWGLNVIYLREIKVEKGLSKTFSCSEISIPIVNGDVKVV